MPMTYEMASHVLCDCEALAISISKVLCLKCGAAECISKGLRERPEMVEVQGAHQTLL
jgi:hypothetical protein